MRLSADGHPHVSGNVSRVGAGRKSIDVAVDKPGANDLDRAGRMETGSLRNDKELIAAKPR